MTADDALWVSHMRQAQAQLSQVASNPKLPEDVRRRFILDLNLITNRHIDELDRVDSKN